MAAIYSGLCARSAPGDSPAWLGKADRGSSQGRRRVGVVVVVVVVCGRGFVGVAAAGYIRLKSNDLHLKFKYSVHFVCVVFKALTAWNQTAFDALSLASRSPIYPRSPICTPGYRISSLSTATAHHGHLLVVLQHHRTLVVEIEHGHAVQLRGHAAGLRHLAGIQVVDQRLDHGMVRGVQVVGQRERALPVAVVRIVAQRRHNPIVPAHVREVHIQRVPPAGVVVVLASPLVSPIPSPPDPPLPEPPSPPPRSDTSRMLRALCRPSSV